jgi:nucleoside-diphosphate-sugar epimerase
MPSTRTLVTGADGYLGGLLVRHLLSHSDRSLLLWTRAGDRTVPDEPAATRLEAVQVGNRVQVRSGDLRSTEPFRDVDLDEVDSIVHLAAVTSFTVSRSEADLVNRLGTAKVLRLADRCPRLESVTLASTLYASGLQGGSVAEVSHDGTAGFANEYERSKWAAEQLGLAYRGARLSILRLATVLADDDTGRASTHNALHHTLELLRHGLLALMPGHPATPVHLITGDLAVRALAAALDSDGAGIYHVTAPASHTLTLGQAIDLAFEVFGGYQAFLRRGVRRPRFVDFASFQLLADGASSFGAGILGQALSSLLPFARQLYVAKDVRNDRLAQLLPGHRPDSTADVFARMCARLSEGDRGAHVRG